MLMVIWPSRIFSTVCILCCYFLEMGTEMLLFKARAFNSEHQVNDTKISHATAILTFGCRWSSLTSVLYVLQKIKISDFWYFASIALYRKHPSCLVKIIDSIMALFRVDYSGRGELSERQQKVRSIQVSRYCK